MAAIDIGSGAIDLDDNVSPNYTSIDTGNPANEDGTIDTVEIFAVSAYGPLAGCKVGIFYNISGNTYKCRSAATIGAVPAGSKQTFAGQSLAVVAGDVIGVYYTSGRIEKSASGGTGNWLYGGGDHCVVDDQNGYSSGGAGRLGLYGTGSGGVVVVIGTTVEALEAAGLI